MKDKLDQALDDERLINAQNRDEVDANQRYAQRTAADAMANTTLNRFAANQTNVFLTRQPPVNPQQTNDILARMLDRAAPDAQQQGLLAQLRAGLANPAALPRVMNAMMAQVASLILGNKLQQDADKSVKDRRDKEDEAAERENPGLLLIDVSDASGVNAGPQ